MGETRHLVGLTGSGCRIARDGAGGYVVNPSPDADGWQRVANLPAAYAVCERFVITEPDRDIAWIARGKILISPLKFRRSAAKQDELHIRIQHLFQRAKLDIHAFLFCQPRNLAEERGGWVDRQTNEFLQLRFADFFSSHARHGKIPEQMLIISRIPLIIIDPVKDSHEPVGS